MPALRLAVLPSLVQPGAAQKFAISYVQRALVQARISFPGRPPLALYTMTDRRGHLALSVKVPRAIVLCGGRASVPVSVRAMSGRWDLVVSLAPVVYRGYVVRIVVSTTPRTPVHAVATFPGLRPVSRFATTDSTGILIYNVAVPPTLRGVSAVAHVAVWRLRVGRTATTTAILHVSDMVVSARAGPIVDCRQTQFVRVGYRPGARLRIVAWLDGRRRFTAATRTDRHGAAAVRVRLSYWRSHSPARIAVQVSDATRGAHRTERIAFQVVLPKRC